jgi:hypothetical protein
MAQYKVKFFCLEDENSTAELNGRVSCQPNESYSDFRGRLELAKCVEWSFDFWDVEDRCRIKSRMEDVDTIGTSVYVIRRDEGEEHDRAKRRRVEATGTSEDGLLFGVPDDMPQFPDNDPLDSVEPIASSRVSGTDVDDFAQHDMQSLLLSKEFQEKYLRSAAKLKKELHAMDLDDTLWNLRSWDENGVPVVKLHCGECKKGFGGQSGDHSKAAIHNLLNNFKVSHIVSTLHAKAWCRRKGISYDEHPQDKSGKAKVLTTTDHRALVEEGLSILRSVNEVVSSDNAPFILVGDAEAETLKSFWY